MTEKNPKISVVMPVYNAGPHLRKSIESILRQTFTDFEFIIIDDGSKDNSWSVIQEFADRDSRIVALHQANLGVVATANKAAYIAKGEYISRTDADDISLDSKLADLIATANANPKADVIAGSIEVIDENDEFLYRALVPVFNDDLKRSLYIRNPIPNGATLLRRSTFLDAGGFADVFAEDCYLWSQLWSASTFVGTGTTVYKWRVNPTGLTMSNNKKSIQKEQEYLSKLWDIGPPAVLSLKQINARSNQYLQLPGRFGADYKDAFLYDLCRVAAHQIKRGFIQGGIVQLVLVSLTGRRGLKTVLKRLLLSSRGAVAVSVND